MPIHIDKALGRWLNAESAGDSARAERVLATVFRQLPLATPSAGFADRVVAATDLRLEARCEPRRVPWWARATVAASVLLGALSLVIVVPTFFGAVQLLDPAEVVTSAVAALDTVAQRLADLGLFWDLATRLRDSLLALVSVPQVSLALLFSLAVSSLALRALTELLSPHRSPTHVTP